MRQIIINLVANAFKFTQKGSVSIKLEKLEDSNDYQIKGKY